MKKTKQILSIIGVILLSILYLSTIFFAIFDSSKTMGFFKVSIAFTIIVPVLLYAYTLFYKLSHKRDDDSDSSSQ